MRFKAWSKDVGRMLVNCSQAFEGQVFQWVSEGQNLEILQGTGLNDVDGNEIFEGDIVKWDDCILLAIDLKTLSYFKDITIELSGQPTSRGKTF